MSAKGKAKHVRRKSKEGTHQGMYHEETKTHNGNKGEQHKTSKKTKHKQIKHHSHTHYETMTEGSQVTQEQQLTATAELNDTFSRTGLPPSFAMNGGSALSFSFQPRTTGATSNDISAPSGFPFGTRLGAPSRTSFGGGGTHRRTGCFQRVESGVVTGSGPPASNHTAFQQVSNSFGSNSSGSSSFGSQQNNNSTFAGARARDFSSGGWAPRLPIAPLVPSVPSVQGVNIDDLPIAVTAVLVSSNSSSSFEDNEKMIRDQLEREYRSQLVDKDAQIDRLHAMALASSSAVRIDCFLFFFFDNSVSFINLNFHYNLEKRFEMYHRKSR
jgi:hypothetical protein